MISATGRMPAIAEPMAAQTTTCSKFGVVRTRPVPNSVDSTWVSLQRAAALGVADVLAGDEDRTELCASAGRAPEGYRCRGRAGRTLRPGDGGRASRADPG